VDKSPGFEFAILFIDLDRFKSVNDTLGHLAGDQLLVAAAHAIESCLRPGDTLSRLGGDEFALLLEGIRGAGDASAVAVFDMTGGLVYTYRGSWCAEGCSTPWDAAWRAIGTEGSLTWDGEEGFRAEVVTEGEGFRRAVRAVEIPPAPPEARTGGHAGLIREFVDCIRSEREPETSCADNIRSLAMVFDAIESAWIGGEVTVEW